MTRFRTPGLRASASTSRRPTRSRPALEGLETRSLLSVTATSYLGLDSSQNDPLVEPPDPIIAAGPNTVVEMVNTRIAIYNKSGVLQSQESLSSLFPTDAGLSFSDPQATYDTIHQRFFVGAV